MENFNGIYNPMILGHHDNQLILLRRVSMSDSFPPVSRTNQDKVGLKHMGYHCVKYEEGLAVQECVNE